MLVVDVVCSNLMCGSKELHRLKKFFSFSSPCVHMKKMSSMYLNQTRGWSAASLKK